VHRRWLGFLNTIESPRYVSPFKPWPSQDPSPPCPLQRSLTDNLCQVLIPRMPLTLPRPHLRKRGKDQPVKLSRSSRGARPCTLRFGSDSGASSLRNDLRRAGASCLRRRSRREGRGLGGNRRGSPGNSRWRGPACLGSGCCFVRLGCRSRNGSYAGAPALNLLKNCVRDRTGTGSWSPEPRYS
jgi:hypothetical protein